MPRTLAVRSDDTRRALNHRQAFRTRGNLRAEEVDGLTQEEAAATTARCGNKSKDVMRGMASRVRYIVWSYELPVAWATADDVYIVRDAGYSNTTTSHRVMVSNAMALSPGYFGPALP